MAPYVQALRMRKFSPIDREYPIIELVDGDQVILDIAAADDGTLEVAIHESATNKLFQYKQLLQWLEEGRRLLEVEMQ